MHERYTFGVLVFLPLAFPDRRAYWLAAIFGLVFTLNLLTAIPLSPAIGAALPATGPLAIAGSIAMLGILAALLVVLRRSAAEPIDTLGLRWGGP
jgi:hypothetical protein